VGDRRHLWHRDVAVAAGAVGSSAGDELAVYYALALLVAAPGVALLVRPGTQTARRLAESA